MQKFNSLFSKTHYQRMEEKHIKKLFKCDFSQKKILDIGCGKGKYLRLLDQSCKEITGVDINPQQVLELRQEGFNVFTPDELPKEKKYDVLLMSHIIEHFNAKELLNFFENYIAMLADDGALVIYTPMPGVRFWHDYTHVRPYTPQSLGMIFGILDGPSEFTVKNKMRLENISFFRDSWRVRDSRYFYSIKNEKNSPSIIIMKKMIIYINLFLAGLHIISHGKLGRISSWSGVYRKELT